MSNKSAASGARVTYVTMTAFSSDKGREFVRVRAKFSPHISAEEEWSWWEDIHRRTRLGAILNDGLVIIVPRYKLEVEARQLRDAIHEVGGLHGHTVEFVTYGLASTNQIEGDQAVLDKVLDD